MAAISGGGPLRRSGRLNVLSPGNNSNSEARVAGQAASDSAGRTLSGNGRLSKTETRETRYARRNRASEVEDSSLNESARDGQVREGKDSQVESPAKRGDPNPAQSGTPTKSKVLSPSKIGTPTKSKAVSPRNVGTSTKGKGFNLRMAETPTKSKDPSPRKFGIPNIHERISPIKSGASTCSKAHSPINDKGLSPVRDGPPNNAPRSVATDLPSKNKAQSPTNVQSPIKGNAPSPLKSSMNENLQSPAKASSPLKAGSPVKGKASSPLKVGSPFKGKAQSPLKTGSPVKGKAGSPCKTSPMNAKCASKRKAQSPSRGASHSKKKVSNPAEEEPFTKEKASTLINVGKGTVLSPVKSGFINKRKAASPTDNGSPSKRKAPSPAETGYVGLSKVANPTGIGLDSGTKLQNHIETGPVTEAKAQCIADVCPSKDHENIGSHEPSTKHGAQSPENQRLLNNVQDLFDNEHADGQKVQVPDKRIIHGFSESDLSSKCESGLSVSSRAKDSSESGPSSESRAQDPSELGLSRETRSVVHGTPSSVRDPRIWCCSKQIVQEVLAKCNEFSKEVMESQQHVSSERKEQELRNCIWDFEKAFQENITVNGEAWHEAPDTQNEPDIKILEDKLDDAIVDTAMKRKRYPRKILSHVVKMLKTEREILTQTKPAVHPEEIKFDSQQASRMVDLTAVTTNLSKHISETMKALPAQIEKANGFSHVLSLQPILESSRTRKEIFCSQVKLVDLAKKLPRPLETTRRDTEAKMNVSPVLSRKRQTSQSPNQKLYPLRSKRKISQSS